MLSPLNLSRPPRAVLAPFVDVVWASAGGTPPPSDRELVLPTGGLHLVLRLEEEPLRVFGGLRDPAGATVGTAVIGGARTASYLRDISTPVASVGALLRPGAAAFLIGAPAIDFSHRHTPLEDAWGHAAVDRLRTRLAETADASCRLDLFEAALIDRISGLRRIDPRVAHALAAFDLGTSVAVVARDLDISHRHFTQLFRTAVGLAPKSWCRLRRFGRALDRLAGEPEIAWAELAAAEGYADQAHFTREFRAFAGLAPGDYRRRAPRNARHVPL